MSFPSHSEQPNQTVDSMRTDSPEVCANSFSQLGWECHETAALVWPKVSASILRASGERVSPRTQGGHVRNLRLCETRRGALLGVPAHSRDLF